MNSEKLKAYLESNDIDTTKKGLNKYAKELGILKPEKMTKPELIAAMRSKWAEQSNPKPQVSALPSSALPSGEPPVSEPSETKTKTKRPATAWNRHCATWAKENGVKLADAIKNKDCKLTYYKAQLSLTEGSDGPEPAEESEK